MVLIIHCSYIKCYHCGKLEAGWWVNGTSVYYFCNFLWVYCKNKKLKKVINPVLILFLRKIYWTIFDFHGFSPLVFLNHRFLKAFRFFIQSYVHCYKECIVWVCAHRSGSMCILRAVIFINSPLGGWINNQPPMVISIDHLCRYVSGRGESVFVYTLKIWRIVSHNALS